MKFTACKVSSNRSNNTFQKEVVGLWGREHGCETIDCRVVGNILPHFILYCLKYFGANFTLYENFVQGYNLLCVFNGRWILTALLDCYSTGYSKNRKAEENWKAR